MSVLTFSKRSPKTPVLLAHLRRHPMQPHADFWSLSLALDVADGFQRIELQFDIGRDLPMSSRAIVRDRVFAFIEHSILRLSDASLGWRTDSFTAKDRIFRGVTAGWSTEKDGWASIYASFDGVPPVPAWYKGVRRDAIIQFLRTLDFTKTDFVVE